MSEINYTKQDHLEIFLQQDCCVDEFGEGRMWCQDDVFTGECEHGKKPTKYIRADMYDGLYAELNRLNGG